MCQSRALGGRDLDPENLVRAGGLAADFIEWSRVSFTHMRELI
jgi:hypothetical protein